MHAFRNGYAARTTFDNSFISWSIILKLLHVYGTSSSIYLTIAKIPLVEIREYHGHAELRLYNTREYKNQLPRVLWDTNNVPMPMINLGKNDHRLCDGVQTSHTIREQP